MILKSELEKITGKLFKAFEYPTPENVDAFCDYLLTYPNVREYLEHLREIHGG